MPLDPNSIAAFLSQGLGSLFGGGGQVQPMPPMDPAGNDIAAQASTQAAQAAQQQVAQGAQQAQQEQQQQGGGQPQGGQPQQPQQPGMGGGMGNSLMELGLPLLAGLGAAMTTPRLAGPGAKFGAGLSAAVPAFINFYNARQMGALRQAMLQNTMRHQTITEELASQKNQIALQKNQLEYGPAGQDLFADLRKDPNVAKWLPSPEVSKNLPMKVQGQLLAQAPRWAEMAQRGEDMHMVKMQGLQLQAQGLELKATALQQHADEVTARLDEAKRHNLSTEEATKELRAIQQQATDVNKQRLDMQKQLATMADETKRWQKQQDTRNKLTQEYDKRTILNIIPGSMGFEDFVRSRGYDPDTMAPLKKGGAGATPASDRPEL